MTPENTTETMLAWIEVADYEATLRLWRFEDAGSPWFKGEVGEAFQKKMGQHRRTLGRHALVAASKRVGFAK